MFKSNSIPLHVILKNLKEVRYLVPMNGSLKYNFNFLEALFLNIPVKLIAHENEQGWLVFSSDASMKLTTLTDFLDDKILIEGFDFMPELNGLKYSELKYTNQYHLNSNNISVLAFSDLDQLNKFADKFKLV